MFHPTRIACLCLGACLALTCVSARAWDLAGRKTITVHTRDRQEITMGQVEFSPVAGNPGSGRRFKVEFDHSRFQDFFLSMKEFKCINAAVEVSCHVPYPYPHPGTVSDNDFSWLEHQLLFLYKPPAEFGAKLWNGLYFQLRRESDGLLGEPLAVDLNRISAPPDDTRTPPLDPSVRDPIAPGSRWITHIRIR
ncbi:MAG: hypothetical protein K9K38_11670 [Rhodoferax sp.]|nr:hypothetical protein [Rhodoferax sp.]